MRRTELPLALIGGLAASALLLTAAASAARPPAPSVPKSASRAAQEQMRTLAQLGADRWHTEGFRGQGVKVAVLDTGFRGWKEQLGKALPGHVTVRSFRRDGNLEFRDSQHGILCGEVVHSIAPQAELLFANWEPGHADQFLAAVRWAKEQGARVVSVSVIMPSWSDGQGGGTVHRALSGLLGRGNQPVDLLCFASAGNTTERHWAGSFRDGGAGWHAWAPGKIDNGLRPWPEDEVAVELYGRAGGAYELVVLDEAGKVVGRSATDPAVTDRLSAEVRFAPNPLKSYSVRVRHLAGPAGEFHLTTTFAYIDITTPGANVCFPGDGPEVVAVGAVDSEGHRQPYSAIGSNLRLTKPDLSAAVPVPSGFRAKPFGGTSAACPQAAALAALCLSKHPNWSPVQVRDALRAAAIDLGKPGPDPETGFGLVHLPAK